MDVTQINIDPAKLRRAREDAGLTQQEAADRAGVVKQTISNIECGVMLPSANVLARICAVYGVTNISDITTAQAA